MSSHVGLDARRSIVLHLKNRSMKVKGCDSAINITGAKWLTDNHHTHDEKNRQVIQILHKSYTTIVIFHTIG